MPKHPFLQLVAEHHLDALANKSLIDLRPRPLPKLIRVAKSLRFARPLLRACCCLNSCAACGLLRIKARRVRSRSTEAALAAPSAPALALGAYLEWAAAVALR